MKKPAGRTAAVTGKAARLAKRPEGRNAANRGRNSLHSGTKVNAVFTLCRGKRYANAMLFLATAAAMALMPQVPPNGGVRASVQAQAFVRIITGVSIRLGQGALSGEAPRPHLTLAKADGSTKRANLIEFE
jgi:hypothetical protein